MKVADTVLQPVQGKNFVSSEGPIEHCQIIHPTRVSQTKHHHRVIRIPRVGVLPLREATRWLICIKTNDSKIAARMR